MDLDGDTPAWSCAGSSFHLRLPIFFGKLISIYSWMLYSFCSIFRYFYSFIVLIWNQCSLCHFQKEEKRRREKRVTVPSCLFHFEAGLLLGCTTLSNFSVCIQNYRSVFFFFFGVFRNIFEREEAWSSPDWVIYLLDVGFFGGPYPEGWGLHSPNPTQPLRGSFVRCCPSFSLQKELFSPIEKWMHAYGETLLFKISRHSLDMRTYLSLSLYNTYLYNTFMKSSSNLRRSKA